ncbi:Helix-turn-helix domain-containing protein [Seinonella peptonophila]|uniref:Helix-turn-helix domain-containing protein n=1 Tax=Seinonella peptonophila TaxID=112248 RepID=A0A1M5A6E8_9BACL|nr:helix-turn-helix domain-containing protein [Seinonella peptonophila]SHF25745.1 Helix-turn-helix domain-containing protein [Seinonella peptonophila]
MNQKIQETYRIESPEQATALINPLRVEILTLLKQPRSAAEVARQLREPPQRINYHLKSLEKVGLVMQVGTRQVRNLVEILYQSIARSFLLSESLTWGQETLQKIKDQGALAHLIHTSERIKRDAISLMEHSDQAEQIPSATLQLQVKLSGEEQRQAFVHEYIEMMKELVKRYQVSHQNSEDYQVILAVYPQHTKFEEEKNDQKVDHGEEERES